MKLKLTLQRPGGRSVDILATASADVLVGEFAERLLALDPAAPQHRPAVPTLAVVGRDSVRMVLDADSPLAEASLASGATVTLAEHSNAFRQGGHDAAVLTVLEGPDQGREFRLPVGTHYIGRDPSCDVRLNDPRVSRRHARLHVRPDVEVEDLNSSNGVVLGDAPVQRAMVRARDILLIGDTRLSVTPLQPVAVAGGRVDRSTLRFNRSPVLRPGFEGRTFQLPELERPAEGQSFPFLALLAPLVMGGALFAFTRNPTSLIFIGLSPLLALGAWADGRWRQRKAQRRAQERFDADLAALDTEARQALLEEQAERRAEGPSSDELARTALGFEPALWSRRPDAPGFLTLRLGLADLPSRSGFEVPRGALPPGTQELMTRYGTVPGVPWLVELPQVGALGVVGGEGADDVWRSVVTQLACLHSPSEVVLCALATAASAPAWDWLKWLPHTSSDHSPVQGPHLASSGSAPTLVAALEAVVQERSAAAERSGVGGADRLPAVVVLVEHDAPVDIARLVQIAEHGPRVGVFTVWRTPTAATLPAACRAYAEVEAAGCIAVDVATATRTPITADRVPAAGAAGLARHLAPVADAGAVPVDDSDLPPSQSYLRLRDSQAADEVAEIVERWRENGSLVGSGARSGEPSLRALVGRTATEPLYLDLHAQGPHALVGGTTGAGKSELLQTWVLGMALGYSPQRVNFLFVDYKGGAAFAECLKLPHTVGVVTDLTPHLVRRALTSLRAELRFREHLLNAEGAKDLATLERRGSASAPPRLVIVVDEFAALVQEVPEFIDGVVDVAQRGRSLGLHLILATQRPAGVIKDNLRANTNLRLALRMADAADSTDILQEPLAAEFDPSIPGRAAVRSGPGRLTVFQTGYVGGRTAGTRDAPAVAVTELTFGVGAIWKEPAPQVVESPAPAGPNDLANMVGWLKTASRSLELALPRKPWNDVVPPLVDLVDLRPRTDEALPFALVDVPAEQTRRVHAYRPDEEGNLVAFGAGGSGKTTLLRTLAAAAGMTRKGGPVQVYAIDAASGGLAMLTELPHVGAVIAGEDFERVERLLRWLRAVVDERAVEYSELRAGSIVEYRSQAGKPDEPRILILIDGLATLVEQLESSGRARQVTALQQLAGEGRQVGVHFAVTADRLTAVPFGMRSTLQNRVVLRLADEGDYGLLGASVDVLSLSSPPGRAVLGDLEMQVAVLGGEATVAAQATEFRDLADSLRHAGAGLRAHPSPIERLPALVPSDTLKPAGDGRPVLGIADETLAPFAFDPRGVLLVSGPPGSGRTTALAALVAATLQAEPLTRCYYVGSPHSPLATGRPWSGAALDPAAAAVLAEELRGRLTVAAPGTVPPLIVLDGLSDFTSTPAEAALEAVVRAAGGGAALLLAEGETTALAQYGSLPQALKAPRRGLVLQPDINDADILRTALPKAHRRDFPPGRGYFVERGNATKVQVALPE